MVYEMRIYTVAPGRVAEFQSLFEKEALPAIRKYSRLVGWWSSESGNLNEMIRKVQPMLLSQENKLLTAAAFSPLR